MKLHNTILTLIFAFIASLSHAQNFEWVKQFQILSSQASAQGQAITTDDWGNVYSVGVHYGYADFDPGQDTLILRKPGIYISKLGANGECLWAKNFDFINNAPTYTYAFVSAIKVDHFGNAYIGGYFSGEIDFDPGIDSFKLANTFSVRDSYLAKLDANGSFVCAKKIATDSGNVVDLYSIELGYTGDIYLSGKFTGTTDFDPSPGTSTITPLGTAGSIDESFITKWDTSGNFVWAKNIGTTNSPGYSTVHLRSLKADVWGNIYMVGDYYGKIDFDPGAGAYILTAPLNSQNAYVCKWDNQGHFVWLKEYGALNWWMGIGSIDIDSIGNLYMLAGFGGSVDFDPDPNTSFILSSANGANALYVLDTAGNFVGAKKIIERTLQDNATLYSYETIDNAGNLYVTGDFAGGWTFYLNTGNVSLTFQGAWGGYIYKANLSGGAWLKQVGKNPNVNIAIRGITLDLCGDNLYTTGYFHDSIYFDVGTDSTQLTALFEDAFVYKLNLLQNQCSPLNPIISQNAMALTVNIPNAFYQWVDCSNNSLVIGANAQTFMPTANGDYKVIVAQNCCKDTSACYTITNVGISESHLSPKIKAYPNPTSGTFTIDLGNEYAATKVEIFSLIGQLIDTQKYAHSQLLQVEMPVTAGVYFVQVSLPNGESATIKVIKE